MTGIIDVGGGMRGVFSSGIYDCLIDEGVSVDCCIGVSAGSANLITYLAGQRGRTLEFYRSYSKRKEYMSLGNLIRTGSYISLDYIYSVLSNHDGENPLDFERAAAGSTVFLAATTRADDGKGVFFGTDAMAPDDYTLLKASCCLPGVCRPVKMKDSLYFDGGIAEPIPVEKALELGCDRLVLVLTKPRKDYCTPLFATKVLSTRIHSFSRVYELMKTLHSRCDEILKQVQELENQGRILVLEPDSCYGMNTLTTSYEPIMKMYEAGYEKGRLAAEFLTNG